MSNANAFVVLRIIEPQDQEFCGQCTGNNHITHDSQDAYTQHRIKTNVSMDHCSYFNASLTPVEIKEERKIGERIVKVQHTQHRRCAACQAAGDNVIRDPDLGAVNLVHHERQKFAVLPDDSVVPRD
ncbi:MAG: hypothetical protein WC551_08530 [Patescibacteria group bacterium]